MSSELEQRRGKVAALRAEGQNPYPNGFIPSHTLQEVLDGFESLDEEGLKAKEGETVRIAGRIRFWNGFGKSTFIRIHDRSAKLQIYVRVNNIGKESYTLFKGFDIGDIIGAEGHLFRTRTGELTVMASSVQLLTKTVRPLPEKWHGLSDKETRYRQRYVDLMVNDDTRSVFVNRAKIIRGLRNFFEDRGFMEVETPMMHPLVGGAAAKPFKTHHNALGLPLYMRIAPELYLKRLIVGGLERVFELNRNFRNEGLSTRHNPEFTMLEFYQAFATYRELMDLSETLISELAESIGGGKVLSYQGRDIDFTPPYPRLSVVQATIELGGLTPEQAEDKEFLHNLLKEKGADLRAKDTLGHLQLEAFEHLAEPKLWNPTFITDYPVEVSPLARRRDDDPRFTERFELFMGGMEVANGFSELNDPEDQAQRFQAQVEAKAKGDDEAVDFDSDYIRALEYGLPPTAGEGIGVDRLVMLLTDQASIRDVILFPLLRPEAG